MSDYFAEVVPKIRAFMRRGVEARVADEEFGALAVELFRAQRKANSAYAKLCELRGVTDVSDWREIPCVPTAAFKEMEMTLLPGSARERVFYSSGTTQRDRSRHFHSADSLGVYEESLWLWFARNFGARMNGVKWIFLTPPAAEAPNSSLAHMFDVIAGKRKREGGEFFGFTNLDGAWDLNLRDVIERLMKLEVEGTAVAVLGTAFQFVHLLDELKIRGLDLNLSAGSWVLETGGYKGRSREVPKEELRCLLTERLGIGRETIFGEYGMSELSSQGYDGTDGIFRFPPWARAQIVSPETGRDVADGERGLIQIYDLANIWSVMAVQTEDIGARAGDGFSLAGRAALAEARGCSLMSR